MTHPRTPTDTSLTQSSLGRVDSSCGGSVDGRYSISRVISSLVPDAAQYAPREERSRDELMRKSKGMGEAAGARMGQYNVQPRHSSVEPFPRANTCPGCDARDQKVKSLSATPEIPRRLGTKNTFLMSICIIIPPACNPQASPPPPTPTKKKSVDGKKSDGCLHDATIAARASGGVTYSSRGPC